MVQAICRVAAFALGFPASLVAAAEEIDFERHIAPIFADYCLDCHRPGKENGGFNLATAEGVMKGAESGAALVAGKPSESNLLNRIIAGEMPPSDGKHPRRKPGAKEIGRLKAWIAAGAAWPKDRELGLHEQSVDLEKAKQFWSFQPVKHWPVPEVKHHERVANPIDAFILQKLEAAGLELAPRASQRDRLRRAYLDAGGLPPTLEAQERFLSDESPQAYETLVDELLASPFYGERWARHWLDLVRYADSNGYERDGPKPFVWRYRDYVIDSLNADKPYDQFVIEQLAGDELAEFDAEALIGTGFHALGTWQDEVDPLEQPQYRADELDDMVRTTSQTFLGITLGCARCHNHKFDPLTMVDYYSLVAILSPLKRPNVGREDRDRPIGSHVQIQAVAARDKQLSPVLAELDALKKQSQSDSAKIAELERRIAALKTETPDLPRGYFQFEDAPQAPVTHLLLSGRAANPGPAMQPHVPAILTSEQPSFSQSYPSSTGRRTAFAKWVASPENPLTARVMVNRVWQHHFGEGLVATPSDFGDRGARPTHPELLDWLSHWFVHDANWSLKKLHRLILTSETYQAASVVSQESRKKDPENKLLSHFPLHRLDAEAIRDSMLAVSGDLNPQMHGPAVFLPISKVVIESHTDKEQAWSVSPAPQIHRRTVYAYVKRTLLVPMLEVLDLCDVTNSPEKRVTTSIAPQALTLYNGDFVNQQAKAFAQRLTREAGDDLDKQIKLAYRLALSRQPSDTELQTMLSFVEAESAALAKEQPTVSAHESQTRSLVQMCRVILNLNEFVYAN